MLRRKFLKNSALLASGALVAPIKTRSYTPAFSGGLQIVTDRPDQAIAAFERTFAGTSTANLIKSLSETPLAGEHITDLVCLRESQLFDYRQAPGPLAGRLRQLAAELDLQRRVKHPMLLTLRTEQAISKAGIARVYCDNRLIEDINLKSAPAERTVTSSSGELLLQTGDGQASVLQASCKHKTCVQSGIISASGQTIVCIPARIRIEMAGPAANGIDALVF